jgi:NADH-quinone oxidoreductase subunit M
MFGPLDKEENKNLEDVNARELGYLIPIVAMAIIMGVAPNFFLSRMEPSVYQFLTYMDSQVSPSGLVRVETPEASILPQGPMLELEDKAEKGAGSAR